MTHKPLAAELLITSECTHCPVVLDALSTLVKKGLIAQLNITNIHESPERAQQLGVRSVPWIQLGPFILTGLHSLSELTEWAEQAGSITGMSRYIDQELKLGNLSDMENLLKDYPQWLLALIPLLKDENTDMKTRFGVDALMEQFAKESEFVPMIPELGKLSTNKRQALRADVTHYLSLTQHKDAIPFIESRLHDESEEIQEIAREGLNHYSPG